MLILDKETLRAEVRNAMRKTDALDLWTELPVDPITEERRAGVVALLTEQPELLREARALGLYLPEERIECADMIFRALFRERTPVGEAAMRILLTLERLGVPLSERQWTPAGEMELAMAPAERLDRVRTLAKLRGITCLVDPFAENAGAVWKSVDEAAVSAGMLPVLSIQTLQHAIERDLPLTAQEGEIERDPRGAHVEKILSVLDGWADRFGVHMLRADWSKVPFERDPLLRYAILPFCERRGLPMQLVLSAKPEEAVAQWAWVRNALRRAKTLKLVLVAREVVGAKLALEDAADEFGRRVFPVLADKAADPAKIIACAGMRAAAYASGVSVLEQLIGDWVCARRELSQALFDRYLSLIKMGWGVRSEEIEADCARLTGGNWAEFCKFA